jgi:hypothetical protein
MKKNREDFIIGYVAEIGTDYIIVNYYKELTTKEAVFTHYGINNYLIFRVVNVENKTLLAKATTPLGWSDFVGLVKQGDPVYNEPIIEESEDLIQPIIEPKSQKIYRNYNVIDPLVIYEEICYFEEDNYAEVIDAGDDYIIVDGLIYYTVPNEAVYIKIQNFRQVTPTIICAVGYDETLLLRPEDLFERTEEFDLVYRASIKFKLMALLFKLDSLIESGSWVRDEFMQAYDFLKIIETRWSASAFRIGLDFGYAYNVRSEFEVDDLMLISTNNDERKYINCVVEEVLSKTSLKFRIFNPFEASLVPYMVEMKLCTSSNIVDYIIEFSNYGFYRRRANFPECIQAVENAHCVNMGKIKRINGRIIYTSNISNFNPGELIYIHILELNCVISALILNSRNNKSTEAIIISEKYVKYLKIGLPVYDFWNYMKIDLTAHLILDKPAIKFSYTRTIRDFPDEKIRRGLGIRHKEQKKFIESVKFSGTVIALTYMYKREIHIIDFPPVKLGDLVYVDQGTRGLVPTIVTDPNVIVTISVKKIKERETDFIPVNSRACCATDIKELNQLNRRKDNSC